MSWRRGQAKRPRQPHASATYGRRGWSGTPTAKRSSSRPTRQGRRPNTSTRTTWVRARGRPTMTEPRRWRDTGPLERAINTAERISQIENGDLSTQDVGRRHPACPGGVPAAAATPALEAAATALSDAGPDEALAFLADATHRSRGHGPDARRLLTAVPGSGHPQAGHRRPRHPDLDDRGAPHPEPRAPARSGVALVLMRRGRVGRGCPPGWCGRVGLRERGGSRRR